MSENFKEYLNAFQPMLVQKLGEVIHQREELLQEQAEWKDEINGQFYQLVAEELAGQLADNFHTDPETIAIFLETFDIEDWLNK